MCKTLFLREGPWGTHSHRKTGYLFSVWKGGNYLQIMKSARHKDVQSAQKYSLDAEYLHNLGILV